MAGCDSLLDRPSLTHVQSQPRKHEITKTFRIGFVFSWRNVFLKTTQDPWQAPRMCGDLPRGRGEGAGFLPDHAEYFQRLLDVGIGVHRRTARPQEALVFPHRRWQDDV